MKCANCGGPHNANSRDCPVIQKAYKLEKEKISGRNVTSVRPPAPAPIINANENWPNIPGQHDSQRETLEQQPLYSRAVAGPSSDKTTTESSNSAVKRGCSCSCGNNPSDLNREFFEKLKNFVLEIFSIVSAEESSAAKSKLATSAIRNNFGIDLTKSDHPASIHDRQFLILGRRGL